MTATQLDLFGQVEAAEQVEADWQTLRNHLLYDRIQTGADLGYQLFSEQASRWPNGIPAGGEQACAAAYAEMDRTAKGERVPGSPGSCERCDHPMMWHHLCRFACEVRQGCHCRTVAGPVKEHLKVEVLAGAVLSVRTLAEVMTERWARYGLPWPGAKS